MTETTMSPNVFKQLAGLASRLQNDPAFMAYVLTIYQKQERLSDDALAAQLGSTPEMLARLALCKRPEVSSTKFADQVRQIAAYTNTDVTQLANIVRQVDSLKTMSERPKVSQPKTTGAQEQRFYPGLLAAARDRTEAAENDEASSSQEKEFPSED